MDWRKFQQSIDQYKADFSLLKKEIHEVEQNDVDEVKQANEQLKTEIEKLKRTLSEEITRSHAGVRLDINLEKGRIRDEGIQLQEHLRHTDERIESEIRALRKHMEGIKLQILQYMIGKRDLKFRLAQYSRLASFLSRKYIHSSRYYNCSRNLTSRYTQIVVIMDVKNVLTKLYLPLLDSLPTTHGVIIPCRDRISSSRSFDSM